MPIRRVAVLFDNQARPETTGGYCLRALGELVQAEHFLPAQAHQIPRNEFDLYVRIDDGLEQALPDDLRPCAWWAIDTHLEFDRCLAQARRSDVVFASQRDGAARLRQAGIAHADWLPLACDPGIHRRHEVPKQFDVCFVGNLIAGPRSDLLERIRRRFPNTFVGRRYFDEMARTYSAARTVFNRSIRNDINMRVFEALACGSLLLTNDLRDNGQEELFRDGVHQATYREADELLDKISYYLQCDELRSRIETTGMNEALAKHTYRQRMERLLEAAEKLPTRVAVSAPYPVPPANPSSAIPPLPGRPSTLADPSYFEHARPELLAKIPLTARDVLDIGCGAGRLGEALKARQPARVIGLEYNESTASAARQRLDDVLVGDVEAMSLPFPDGAFDCVVCGDVLEHLREPLALLRRIRGWLRAEGTLVASIPNVRHHSVLRGLLDGHWTYEAAGLLDGTHLRFYTRREIEKLFFRAGFLVNKLTVLPGPEHSAWEAQGRPGEVKVGRLHIGGLSAAEAEEFYCYQYLAEVRPAPLCDFGLTSIVILTHNELPCTRQCVSSLRLFTDEPHELIFVDNASSDGTRAYLEALAATDPNIHVILNDTNRGFPAAANQGIQTARGRQVLLLNNDTVLTTGWLHRLLRALYADPTVGMVGPCSNWVSGEQQVPVRYDADLTGLDGFAWDWAVTHDGQFQDTDRLVGFCLLIRREVIDQVGALDDRFGLGCFEDDDYCLRVRQAGFRLRIAQDAFVHHWGSRTFAGAGIDQMGLLRANRALFQRKWEAASETQATAPSSLSALPVSLQETGGLRVLLLAHIGYFRDRMDKSHYYRYEALARCPGVTLFGPGLPGYRPGMSVQEAVQVACGGVRPDVIVHGGDIRASNVPLVTGLAEAPALTAIELLDSWSFEDRQVEFIRQQRFAVGLIQEGGHHLAFYQEHCPATRFFWTPNAVNTRLFRDHALAKAYDIIFYGSTSAEVYPLRARLARLLVQQRDLRVRHIPHPGYYPDAESQATVIAGEALSREINRAWIGIATRSIYHCFLMKYLEITASRALVAGDLPDSARPLFQDGCIELSLGQSDDAILQSLRQHLADKDRLRAMTDAVHQRVVSAYSTDAYAQRVLHLFGQLVSERRTTACPSSTITAPLAVPALRPEEKAARPSGSFILSVAPGGGLLLTRTQPLLSLCMIVRDNARIIAACLQSIRPWVDEMIVVDTGSVDETPQIAAELGARVFHFPWCDSFAAARNEPLRHARGRWIFWMDSDDVIDEVNGRKLRDLAAQDVDLALMGYVMQVRFPGPGAEGHLNLTVVDQVKLIRNRPDLRFEGRIHEQILSAIRRAGGTTAWTDVFVVHANYDHSPEGQRKKLERDLRLLYLELKEQPDHPFTLFNLGMTYADQADYPQAIQFLQRSIACAGPGESHLRKAYALLVYSYAQTGAIAPAWDTCRRGLELFPQDVELRFRQAILLSESGQLREAAQVYQDLLNHPGERHFTSVDPGIAGFKARQNLAVVLAALGDVKSAEAQWRLLTQEMPSFGAGWRGLGDVLLRQGKQREALTLAEQLLGDPALSGEGRLLKGQAALAAGDVGLARREFQQAMTACPDDPAPVEALCRLLFEQGNPSEAEGMLLELIRRAPDDAAAHHNLGTIHLRRRNPAAAAAAYQQSLRFRPHSAPTAYHLGCALFDLGRLTEASATWERVLQIAPGHADAAAALARVRQQQR